MFTVLIAFDCLDDFPSHQLRMYGGQRRSAGFSLQAVTWGQGTSTEFSFPAPQHPPPACSPLSIVAVARKACERLAVTPALTALGVGEGTGDAHLLSLRALGWGRPPARELCMAVPCMCCPSLAAPARVALPVSAPPIA